MAENERLKFQELKKRITGLPLAERIAEEVRLARELGVTVTVDNAVAVGIAAERQTRLERPSHIAEMTAVPARGQSGAHASGLGGLVAKLPDLDRKALSCIIEADLARLAGPEREHVLGRLAEHLDLLDALDPSRKATVAIRKRIGEAVFGGIAFMDEPKQTGGGASPAKP